MADEKKKLSTAEILALARANKAGDGAAPAPPPKKPAAPVAEEPAPAPEATEAPPAPAKPAAKPGGRPSVQEMMAMARAEKAAGAKPAAPAEKPAAAAKPAPKADKPAAKPAAEKSAAPAAKSPGVRDTASILAAARGGAAKAGPLSKAEAAAKQKADAEPEKPAKAKLVVPPMPAKPDYAKGKEKPAPAPATAARRDVLGLGVLFGSFLALGYTALAATAGVMSLGLARFMFPNVLVEPPSRFKVGFPSDFPPGSVEEKFKAQFGVWIVNTEFNGQQQLVALRTVCTHLGCTPNWLDAEQKFKCPCHGSGFYKDGINFEGPAPRPLERYSIRLADDGQLEVDKSRLFQEELGQWNDPASFVPA